MTRDEALKILVNARVHAIVLHSFMGGGYHNLLQSAFSWEGMPQGYRYWSDFWINGRELPEEATTFLSELLEHIYPSDLDWSKPVYAINYCDYYEGIGVNYSRRLFKSQYNSRLYTLSSGYLAPLSSRTLLTNEKPEGYTEGNHPWNEADIFKVLDLQQARGEYPRTSIVNSFRQILERSCDFSNTHPLCFFEQPELDNPCDPSTVNMYMSYKDYERGRKTPMKLGRAVRRMLPKGTRDSVVLLAVNEIKEMFSEREYTLHIGSSREDFSFAYSDDLAKSYDPYTTESRKGLHNSCMRGVEVYGVSPAEVYASGEFKIAYLTDTENRIAGRVIVWFPPDDTPPQSGLCYGVCEQSLNTLEAWVKEVGATPFDESSWEGAKLLKIESKYGDLIGPYSDMEQEGRIDGDYIILGDGGLELNSTEGYINGAGSGREWCEYCECYHSDVDYVSGLGAICEGCLEENYTQDYHGEWIHVDYAVTVCFYNGIWGRRVTHLHDDQEGEEFVYSEHMGENWLLEDVTYVESREDYIPNYLKSTQPELFEEEQEEEEKVA